MFENRVVRQEAGLREEGLRCRRLLPMLYSLREFIDFLPDFVPRPPEFLQDIFPAPPGAHGVLDRPMQSLNSRRGPGAGLFRTGAERDDDVHLTHEFLVYLLRFLF